MKRVRLIHWNAAEAEERAEWLRGAGLEVVHDTPRGRVFLQELRSDPPDALIIDLSRLPAQGRDHAVMVRHQNATSRIPLLHDPQNRAELITFGGTQ